MSDKKKVLIEYLKEIDKVKNSGVAKEHSYRSTLEKLLKDLIPCKRIVNEPKKIDCGKPDLIAFNGDAQFGFIETKDIDIDISKIIKTEQIQRYKEALNNIIVTNYIDFIYFKDDNVLLNASIGIIVKGSIRENKEGYDALLEIIDNFTNYEGKIINNAEMLAKLMARKTKLLSQMIIKSLDNNKYLNCSLREQMNKFKEYLIHELTEFIFADIYSQTIAYGFFAAKLYDNSGYNFTRLSISELIPKSNPFLKQFYHYIMGTEIDENIKWFIDLFADMFNMVDIKKIKRQFDEKDKDPYIYFYETFLNEYDKVAKREKGVFYTPTPIVKFIVNSVDSILKKSFNLEKGIADDTKIKIKTKYANNKIIENTFNKVQILDPATGTGTFLAEIIDKIYDYYKNDNKGLWNDYCENELINRIHGFEYMMASYTMAHLKIDMKLKETGFDLGNCLNKRLGIYLTNTLEVRDDNIKELGLSRWLSDEALAAQKVKNNVPVMVIIGNPPYSGESKNKYEDEVYLSYKNVDEKNKKPLNDDYVKFLAYGHSLIKKYNEGILAYINNNGFLDNITFSSMRLSLLNTFDEIYILNLYGDLEKNKNNNAMKDDENVFAITKGVCVNIFVKNNKNKSNDLATVYYAEIIGSQVSKYKFLSSNIIGKIKWKKINYKKPEYFFIEKNYSNIDDYDEGFSVKDMFNVYSSGAENGRDDFGISEDKNELITRIKEFYNMENSKAREYFNLGEDTSYWKIEFVKKDLEDYIKSNYNEKYIIKYQYKPFDIRYTFYSGKSNGYFRRPSGDIMQHFINNDNIGLIFKRGIDEKTSQAFITKNIIDRRSWSRSGMQGADYIAPLYVYTSETSDEKQPNLKKEIIQKFENISYVKFGLSNSNKTFTSEDIIYYIYAVLHSIRYRSKYIEFLKIEFPKVKYPKDVNEFRKLVILGKKLKELHLMENISNKKISIKYPVNGNDEVNKKIIYDNGKVYINNTQYFENITPEIWEYFIGGYQPAQKWLNERKGKILNYENKKHYMNIIFIIEQTIEIQKKIDEVIEI